MKKLNVKTNGLDLDFDPVAIDVFYYPPNGIITLGMAYKESDFTLDLSLIEAAKLYAALFSCLKESMKDIDLTMNNMG